MNIIQTIISYLAIAGAFISSLFSFGNATMTPFKNDYEINIVKNKDSDALEKLNHQIDILDQRTINHRQI